MNLNHWHIIYINLRVCIAHFHIYIATIEV